MSGCRASSRSATSPSRAVGAYTFALLAIPVDTKATLLPNLPAVLAEAHLPTVPAMIAAGLAASLVALVVAIPLMRINGLSAALGTLALLIIVNQVAATGAT